MKTDPFRESLGFRNGGDSVKSNKQPFARDRYVGSVFPTDFEHCFVFEIQMRIAQYEF